MRTLLLTFTLITGTAFSSERISDLDVTEITKLLEEKEQRETTLEEREREENKKAIGLGVVFTLFWILL